LWTGTKGATIRRGRWAGCRAEGRTSPELQTQGCVSVKRSPLWAGAARPRSALLQASTGRPLETCFRNYQPAYELNPSRIHDSGTPGRACHEFWSPQRLSETEPGWGESAICGSGRGESRLTLSRTGEDRQTGAREAEKPIRDWGRRARIAESLFSLRSSGFATGAVRLPPQGHRSGSFGVRVAKQELRDEIED